jgi:hypothetical protein
MQFTSQSTERYTRRFIQRFVRRLLTVSVIFMVFAIRLAIAHGQTLDVSRDNGLAPPQARAPHVLPGALSAELDPATTAVGTGWGGYNSASAIPVFTSSAEVWIVPRVSLMAGLGTTTQPGTVSARAQGGARVLVLDQQHHGVNAGVGFLYRQDRFANEDGMLEWSALVSRRFGTTLAVANFIYAQDGEGDDREGELRLIGLHDFASGLHLGLDNRVRTTLGSSDPHRAEHSNPSLEFNAGPLLAYTIDRWAIMAEAGVSGMKVDRLNTGMLVLGGVGAAF